MCPFKVIFVLHRIVLTHSLLEGKNCVCCGEVAKIIFFYLESCCKSEVKYHGICFPELVTFFKPTHSLIPNFTPPPFPPYANNLTAVLVMDTKEKIVRKVERMVMFLAQSCPPLVQSMLLSRPRSCGWCGITDPVLYAQDRSGYERFH